ncbi:rhomboid family protein [Pontibacter harenae]|uniref:rhomboid family protein n=1 Tax=Pontibacter harenae TaxID=2894083 RepID=UPI001E4A6D37|nr:rhomboid family intramembrane serine protease [Pontibacter harenae]MCC9168901.1 rhomboid family intramembrane serine protease [Pontibacter harenae]
MSIFQDIKDSFRQPNNTLKQLILINVIVFVVLVVSRTILSWSGSGWMFVAVMDYISLPSIPYVLLFRPWTLITYFFTHVDFLHIIFNMLNMYWFGQLVREYLGDKRLLSLYILGGLAGGILFVVLYNVLPLFSMTNAQMIGASASVLAIVVAAATLLPNYSFNLLLLGPVKIKYIAAVLVFVSFAFAAGENAGGNIAHLGGALLGWVFVKQLQRGNDLGRPIHATFDFFTNLFKRKPKLKVSHRRTSGAANGSKKSPGATTTFTGPGKPSQNEIDRILDKISSSGYESLSKEEKQKLFQASQKE